MPAHAKKLHENCERGAGHAQVAARQHECLGLLAAAIHLQAHLFERHGTAVGDEYIALGLLARNGLGGDLLAGDLRKVGILVGAEQRLAARSDVLVLGCGRRFDTLDDQAGLVSLGVASLLLDFEEKLPGFGCDRLREVLDIVRASCRSTTWSKCDSFLSSSSTLRAMRFENSVGFSNEVSNGVTSSECTPAIVADMASVVPRSMFT